MRRPRPVFGLDAVPAVRRREPLRPARVAGAEIPSRLGTSFDRISILPQETEILTRAQATVPSGGGGTSTQPAAGGTPPLTTVPPHHVAGPGAGATWEAPLVVPHNAARRIFEEYRPLIDSPAGLTRAFIGGAEVVDSQGVENALKEPAIETRQLPNGDVTGWFTGAMTLKGHAMLDIYAEPPWTHTVPRAHLAARFPHDKSCAKGGSGDATVRVEGAPSDAALEEVVRLGEEEHEADGRAAFEQYVVPYVDHINAHVGDTVGTRVTGKDSFAVTKQLVGRGAAQTALDFVTGYNSLTAMRHAGNRHTVSVEELRIENSCRDITYVVRSKPL